MTIAYDGTRFGGWQIQPNAVSIQALIEEALLKILRCKTLIVSAGRTDAGVHACGQVAHFESSSDTNLGQLHRSLNGLLPTEIRILNIELVPSDFHARYSAKSKEYHYHIHTDLALDPFKRLYVYHYFGPLNIAEMEKGCQRLQGTHDFTSFANHASEGSAAKNPIKTLYRVQLCNEVGGIRIEFEGDGFLYKMIRNMMGTLLEIGKGNLSADFIPKLFDMKDRRLAPSAAAARGLLLVRVNYNKDVSKSAEIVSNDDA